MSAKPKKSGSKKSTKKAAKKTETVSSSDFALEIDGEKVDVAKIDSAPKAAKKVDGAEQARRRRLARFGCPVPRCSLLGINLDTSPRAGRWRQPIAVGDEWVSALALSILDSGVTPEDLERAAARLRKRGEQ